MIIADKTANKTIVIDGRIVGDDAPVLIIAEAGVNHNGDPGLALELIHAAKECGADCVKFQTFRADRLVTARSPKAQYQLETTQRNESQFAMLKKLELDVATFTRLAETCRKADITFLSTPYDVEDIDLLESLDAPAYKIASALSVEPLLLERVAATGKPVLLSTGMCTLDECRMAVDTLRNAGCDDIVALQCTTDYPSRLEDANLRAIAGMREALAVPVGYSDHTQGLTATIAAVALGACAIERHFTLDRSLPGPDHSASSDPAEMKELVGKVRDVERALGSSRKSPTERELLNKTQMRRGIVAARDLPEKRALELNDLAFKRPLAGVSPDRFKDLIGRRLKRAIEQDRPITWDDVA
jgi:N,N'-diacetyllegionaminate synthase